MNTVERSIEIPARPSEVAGAWDRFIDSVLVGRRRLACDDIACVSAVDTGLVTFEPVGAERTRLTLRVPIAEDEPGPARELLEHKASHDLVLFWSYIDGGDDDAEREQRRLREEQRRGRRSVRQHVRDDVDQFSVRRSGRS